MFRLKNESPIKGMLTGLMFRIFSSDKILTPINSANRALAIKNVERKMKRL
jgi:hypothetical protein